MLSIFFWSSGVEYDFFGIGEFGGCKSRKNDFGLQFRFFYYERASLIGGIAVKTGESIVTVTTIKTQYPEDSPNIRQVILSHVRESKTVLDSGFYVTDSGFQVLYSTINLSAELGFWIQMASGISDSFSCFPDSKAQDSGFHKQNFSNCEIRILPKFGWLQLYRSISMDNISMVGTELTFFAKNFHQHALEYFNDNDVTIFIS